MAVFKLAVTSDLHLPITPAVVIADLAKEVAGFDPAALVVAGDVAESLEHWPRCLQLLTSRLRCPILVLPGNHDLWRGNGSSLEKWQEKLPQAVRQAGCVWLEGEAFVQQGVAIAGTIAWYDYSAADPHIQAPPQEFADQKHLFNPDATEIDWPWTDLEFAELVGQALLATLDRCEADAAVGQSVVVTHVPLLECQMCRDSGNPRWAFTNAYFGNLTLGEKVLARKKVSHVISGHTHVGRRQTLTLADGRCLQAHVLDSHYGRPTWLGLVLGEEKEITEARG